MKYRTEHDSMGDIAVEADKLWGAQTQRSLENFKIGGGREIMPSEIIRAFGILKCAAARTNHAILPDKMTKEKLSLIENACEKIADGTLDAHFPLVVYQTGSGTQSNMNINEVIANYGNSLAKGKILHPNDDVNMSQSSNDTFPTAMHISCVLAIKQSVLPSLTKLIDAFSDLEAQNKGVLKCGRTHLQDATPISFSQEISGWRASLERDRDMLEASLQMLSRLALGGTAVGTGLNAPEGFDTLAAEEISKICKHTFLSDENKFHALTSKGELAFAHGALKALACDLMKIANDVRWLASGPRLGLGEIYIPENEPGSSIMPGKVNPTQCEALAMICVRVMANDVCVGLSASQGNFELNVYMPVCADAFLQSCRLLSDGMLSFCERCVKGIRANREKMKYNLENSLMLVTALNPHIGYENAAKVAKHAYENNITLKEACARLGFLDGEQFDKIINAENMV